MGKKLVPELRFPEFGGKWEEKKLGHLGKFYNGLSGKDKSSFNNGNKKYIQYLNIFDNTIIDCNFEDYGYVYIGKNENQNRINYGDLLFTQSSETIEEVGMSAIYLGNEEVYLNSFSFGFTFKTPKAIDYRYIAYLLRCNNIRKLITREGQGSTRFNLSSNRLKDIFLPLPSIREQEKIGNFFFAIDKKLELQQDRIEALEEYKKGMMQKIFNQEIRFKDDNGKYYPEWEEKRLGEVADVIMGQSPNSNSYNNTKEGMPLIQGNADIKGRLTAPQRYTTEPTTVCIVGDLILTVRAPVGCIAKSIHKGCIGRGVCIIRSKHNAFLFYYLQKNELLWNRYAQGSTFTAINSRDIKNFELIMPTKDEQNKIVNFLSLLDKKIELEKGQLENIKEFKKGLMQKMFV